MTEVMTTMASRAQLGFAELVEAAQAKVAQKERSASYYGWIILIGILVIAAAVAWVYCRARGFRGFTGGVQAIRGPWGIKIGVSLECF